SAYVLFVSVVRRHNAELDRADRWKAAYRKIRHQLDTTHRNVILRQRSSLVAPDEFGDLDASKFIKWIRSRLIGKLNDDFPISTQLLTEDTSVSTAITVADDWERERIDAEASMDAGTSPNFSSMNGHEFERYVRNELIRHGWDAEVTPGSG